MTFTPVPKADLWPLASLATSFDSIRDQVLSRLHYAQVESDYVLAAVDDLYTKVGNDLPRVDSTWNWSGQSNDQSDPGSGTAWVKITDGANRVVSISNTDRNGNSVGAKIGPLLVPGTHVVLMDYPGGSVTGFRIYLVTDTVQNKTSWWRFTAQRVATLGTQDLPAAGTVVRFIIGD